MAIEIKTGTGRLHGRQPAFRNRFEQMGGIYRIVRDENDVISLLNDFQIDTALLQTPEIRKALALSPELFIRKEST